MKRHVFTADAQFAVTKVEGKPTTLVGYAMVWNALSTDRGGFKVRLLPGSAKFTNPVLALFHHDAAEIIGNTGNGTLRISTDEVGVKVEIDLPDTCCGRDLTELVGKRYIRGMSFAMVTAPEAHETVENGETIRNCTSFVCDEISVTGTPAFPDASVEVKEEDEPEQMSKTNNLTEHFARWEQKRLDLYGTHMAEFQATSR